MKARILLLRLNRGGSFVKYRCWLTVLQLFDFVLVGADINLDLPTRPDRSSFNLGFDHGCETSFCKQGLSGYMWTSDRRS